MIRGEADLDVMLHERLSGISLTGRTEAVPVFVNVPEEEAYPFSHIPGISLMFIHDVDSPARQRDGIDVTLRRDKDDPRAGFIRYRKVEFRRLFYQVDIYTQSASDLVDLTERVLARLPRQRHALIDADGNNILYELSGMNDASSKIGEERIFRRTLTYWFDAWVLPRSEREAPTVVGVVERINTQIHDDATGEQLTDDWVPTPPTEEP